MRGRASGLRLAGALVAVAVWPGITFAASSITGSVTFDGKAPNLKPLSMDADPACAKKHGKPVPGEMLVLGNGNSMGNVIVWVSKGLPAGKTWPAPKTPVVLDQVGCQYKPHAMGIMIGQPYRILNSDGVLHNVHTLPKINKSFNRAMPATLKETTTTFEKPEPIFQIKCDVHPWMSAYIGVFTHPFYSVTSHRRQVHDLRPGRGDLRDHRLARTARHADRLGDGQRAATARARTSSSPSRPSSDVAIRRDPR